MDFNNIDSFCSIITQVIIVSKNINAYYSAILDGHNICLNSLRLKNNVSEVFYLNFKTI